MDSLLNLSKKFRQKNKMFSLTIKINGRILYDVNAINTGPVQRSKIATIRWYELICGHRLKHDRDLGALNLAGIITEHLKHCSASQQKFS
jgi:hypothetical protein